MLLSKMEGNLSDSRLNKHANSTDGSVEVSEDHFKQLPISILVSILSLLPVEDSAKTSVLSNYWKGLWILSPRLDFGAPELLKKLKTSELPESEWGSKYVEWVNKVLSAHKALHSDKEHVFEELRFCFGLGHSYQKHIDSWLNYALSLKVQSLELNLLNHSHTLYRDYRFPALLDSSTDEYSAKTLVRRNPVVLSEFRILKSLTLAAVGVSGEAIEFLLRKFPLLECLKVCRSNVLDSIRICGRSVALIYIEITDCMRLKSIVVRDACLVFLKVTHNICSELKPAKHELVLENAPKLVHVWVSIERFGEIHPQLFTCHLKILTLSVKFYTEENRAIFYPQLPVLEQLVLIFEVTKVCSSYIPLAYLLRSVPNLKKFVLELKHVLNYPMIEMVEYEEPPDHPLKHLKVVEVRGFQGFGMDEYIVMYLERNARDLERIVLETSSEDAWRLYTHTPGKPLESVPVETIRARNKANAERFKGELPSSIRVVVL